MDLGELVIDKLFAGVDLIISKKIVPTLIVEDIKELNEDTLDTLKESGVKGLILDVDQTLRYNLKNISLENIEWLIMAKSKMNLAVVSNGYDKKIDKLLKKLDIPYYKIAFKPRKASLIKAIKNMNINNTETLMVGDSYLSDMYGGKRVGTKLCLVKKKNKK